MKSCAEGSEGTEGICIFPKHHDDINCSHMFQGWPPGSVIPALETSLALSRTEVSVSLSGSGIWREWSDTEKLYVYKLYI